MTGLLIIIASFLDDPRFGIYAALLPFTLVSILYLTSIHQIRPGAPGSSLAESGSQMFQPPLYL